MPRSGFSSKPITNFGGPSRNALAARNIRYFYSEQGETGIKECKFRTREGHEVAFDPASPVRSMFNFVATDPVLNLPHNEVVFYDGTEVKVYDNLANTISSVSPPLTVSALKISVAQAGTRFYVAAYGANGVGVAQGHVVDTLNESDALFQAPMTNAVLSISLSELASGSVTAGSHNMLIAMVTRDGYTTRPGPVDSVTAEIVPATIVTGGGTFIRAQVTGNPWPVSVVSIAVLMTTVDDPFTYFFVGGATAAVPGGSQFTVNIAVDVSDSALLNSPPAADLFNLFSQDPLSGGGPFFPNFVVPYRNRMVYGAGDKIFISEPFDYQSITEDRHVQSLPGLENITAAYPYRDGNLYLTSPRGTFALSDNGGKPVDWAGPQLVSGRIGLPGIAAVTQDPAQDAAALATVTGFRIFNQGSYGDPPLSFWVPDWGRINWAAGVTIEILDDFDEQCFRVLVPLDGATSPSHEMVFDYKSGKTPETIRYSLNSCPGRYCFAAVVNGITARNEIWMGPIASGGVLKKNKILTQDDGADIADQVYETARILEVEELGGPAQFHGAHYTAHGTAVLQLKGWGQRHNKATDPKITDLSQQKPGDRILRQWLLNDENQSLEFSTQAGWFEMDECEPYFSPWLRQR